MTPVELDAVRARAAMVAAWLEIERLSEPTGSAMVLARTDVPNLLALVAELTRERDEALQGYRDGQSAAGELVAGLLRERDTAEAKGRRWAIEALRDRALYESMLPTAAPMGPWVQHLNAAGYLAHLAAQPTTEETP